MPEHDNTNRGAMWSNQRKELDTHPDYTGSLNVEGVEYFFDAWKRREGANDRAPVLTFRVKRKDKQPQPALPEADQFAGDDDDLPF